MNFIESGANAVRSLNLRSQVPWNMAVNLTARHWRTNSLRMSTSHFMMQREEVSWTPLT